MVNFAIYTGICYILGFTLVENSQEVFSQARIETLYTGSNLNVYVFLIFFCSYFQVLLVASSFMSPAESKSFTNINRVRMFGKQEHCFYFLC